MLNILQTIDLKLLHAINSDWTSPFLDWSLALVSDFGFWKWPLLIAALALLVWGSYRGRLLIMMTLVFVLVGEGINGTIKRVINRPRPYQRLENVRQVNLSGVRISQPGPVEKGRSMPSSHVANNVAFAFLVSAIYGRWARLVWIVVFAVAYSRIYVGSHYPSDVVAALFLALGYSQAAAWATQRLWQTLGPKWLGRFYDRYPSLFPSRQEPVSFSWRARTLS